MKKQIHLFNTLWLHQKHGPFNSPPDIHQSFSGRTRSIYNISMFHMSRDWRSCTSRRASADLAPDLTFPKHDCARDWILKWLEDPQKLQPGTRMPDFFPEAAITKCFEWRSSFAERKRSEIIFTALAEGIRNLS